RPAAARISNEAGSPQADALATLAAAPPQPLGQILAAALRRAPPQASLPALRPRLTTPQTSHHGPPRVRTGFHARDRKSTRLNSSHVKISYAGFCLKKKITPAPA